MKYIKQFGLILFITFLGEVLNSLIPLSIPASVYGMILLYAALMTKVIKLESVKETAVFLVEIMPVMFIPAGAGLLESYNVLAPVIVPVSVITAVSTVVVMAATGIITQAVIRHDNRKKESVKSAVSAAEIIAPSAVKNDDKKKEAAKNE